MLVIKANGQKRKKDEKKAEIVETEKVLSEKKEKVGSDELAFVWKLTDMWLCFFYFFGQYYISFLFLIKKTLFLLKNWIALWNLS